MYEPDYPSCMGEVVGLMVTWPYTRERSGTSTCTSALAVDDSKGMYWHSPLGHHWARSGVSTLCTCMVAGRTTDLQGNAALILEKGPITSQIWNTFSHWGVVQMIWCIYLVLPPPTMKSRHWSWQWIFRYTPLKDTAHTRRPAHKVAHCLQTPRVSVEVQVNLCPSQIQTSLPYKVRASSKERKKKIRSKKNTHWFYGLNGRLLKDAARGIRWSFGIMSDIKDDWGWHNIGQRKSCFFCFFCWWSLAFTWHFTLYVLTWYVLMTNCLNATCSSFGINMMHYSFPCTYTYIQLPQILYGYADDVLVNTYYLYKCMDILHTCFLYDNTVWP